MPRHLPLSKKYDRRSNPAYGRKPEPFTVTPEYQRMVAATLQAARHRELQQALQAKLDRDGRLDGRSR